LNILKKRKGGSLKFKVQSSKLKVQSLTFNLQGLNFIIKNKKERGSVKHGI